MAEKSDQASLSAPRRRVSITRVIAAVVGAAAIVGGTVVFLSRQGDAADRTRAWYAPYVDVTLTPQFAFEELDTKIVRDVVLSFVVADPDDDCAPSWGAAYSLEEAANELELDRRIARFRADGGDVAVSFGGAKNAEPADACTDVDALTEVYAEVVERYDVSTIDLDVEGRGLSNREAHVRRGVAIAAVQAERAEDDRPLAVWITLPVSTSGLTEDGIAAVRGLLEGGVDLAGVNLMTMNFGATRDQDQTMADATIEATRATHRQLRGLYEQVGIRQTREQVWSKLAVTPMIGQNDDANDFFTLDDAVAVTDFVNDQGLGRVSMWSVNRDRPCGPNNGTTLVSNLCSSTEEPELGFSSVLRQVPGSMSASSSIVTEEVEDTVPVDDPATSPYPIWNEQRGYEQGKKVVWRREVYESKWWNQGFQPDTPVINEWDTPWQYIGPVLDDERPPTMTTLAPGTHPDWSPTEIYDKGDMVLLDGMPYRAKWWTQGDRPDAEVANEWDNPWEALGLPDGW